MSHAGLTSVFELNFLITEITEDDDDYVASSSSANKTDSESDLHKKTLEEFLEIASFQRSAL